MLGFLYRCINVSIIYLIDGINDHLPIEQQHLQIICFDHKQQILSLMLWWKEDNIQANGFQY